VADEKKTILMADDADIVVNLGRALFHREGCEVITAMDGRAALRLCQERSPDLALLDLRMPGLGGDEVLAELKADPATADIPVVIISGNSRPEEETRCRAAGAADYLTKPLRLEDLLRRTSELLRIPIRRHVRVPIRLAIAAAGDRDGALEGETRDVSEGGLFLATSTPLKVGDELGLCFRLPYQTRDLEVTGRVMREVPAAPSRGFGIAFVDPSPEVVDAISRFISGQAG